MALGEGTWNLGSNFARWAVFIVIIWISIKGLWSFEHAIPHTAVIVQLIHRFTFMEMVTFLGRKKNLVYKKDWLGRKKKKKKSKVGYGGGGGGWGGLIGMKVASCSICVLQRTDGTIFFFSKKSCYALAWTIYDWSSIRRTLNGHFVLVRQVWLINYFKWSTTGGN